MWSRLPVGRPQVLPRRQWFPDVDPRRRPTVAYFWDQVTVPHVRTHRAYIEYINEIDSLTASSVRPFISLSNLQKLVAFSTHIC